MAELGMDIFFYHTAVKQRLYIALANDVEWYRHLDAFGLMCMTFRLFKSNPQHVS